MGRAPCCDERSGVKKGPWTPEEDEKLMEYIRKHGGHGSWRTLPKHAGLNRCGKSCRLRWTNYLRPDIKRGNFSQEEERFIINLHSVLGNKWSKIAGHLPGRTDNEIKNFWNTHIRKKLLQMGIDPETHKPRTDFNHLLNLTQLLSISSNTLPPWASNNNNNPLLNPHLDLTKIQLLQNLLQIVSTNPYNLSGGIINNNHSPNPHQFQALVTNNSPNRAQLETQATDQYANVNGVLPPKSNTEESMEGILKPWADNVGGEAGLCGLEQKGFGVNNINYGCGNVNNVVSHQNKQSSEMALPALVSESPAISAVVEGGCSGQLPHNSSSSIFEANWEKLLDDDDTRWSDWKEILEFPSTLASPISW